MVANYIRSVLLLISSLLLCEWSLVDAQVTPVKSGKSEHGARYSAYLFAYFTGNAKQDEAIRFALSNDGYNFRALNGNRPVIASEKISSTGGVRDPHILRGADGKTFYMVATDMVSALGWNSNRAMVLLKSSDLVNWASSIINIQNRFAGNDSLLRVWAPQTIYDPQQGKYMIYWSMKHGKDPDKIYYAYANASFTDLETEPRQLFFSPTNGACIDGDIVFRDGLYHLFFKTEGEGAGIKVAVSDKLSGGYVLRDNYVQQTRDPVEGAGVFKLSDSDDYILMYDVYTKGRYQFTRTSDLVNFKVIDQEVNMNFHPRHGTVMPVTSQEVETLVQTWGSATDVMHWASAGALRPINTKVDTLNKSLHLAVKPGTDLRAFDPAFTSFPGISITPKAAQNFSRGPLKYTIAVKGQQPETWQVLAAGHHNPVLEGYFADPDIMYAEKTGRYYIYPTSDGFSNWSGTYFKTFSSQDLVSWKDEGVILDLEKDVSWAKKNAWAPCIIEHKINGQYRYFYYFTAAQKIGVAVADHPVGPFKDSGKPLIDAFPEGISRGQQIDPDVFKDPVSGKYYLYWGNGYMAVAELSDDMMSLKPGTTKIITPNASYNEGSYVFHRQGRYYFMWSENDTRSEDYQVRYGVSNSPTGKIVVPENNLVIAKDKASGIYGTGHHAVLQIPGKDEWYIVYHRFNYPKGITMGRAAGYNREVCIDKMTFDAQGNILPVMPTHKGIEPVAASGNAAAGEKAVYKLVWADEFKTKGPPDSTKWNYERGFVRNEEWQWYQPENATCAKGVLVIEAKRVSKPNPGYVEGSKDWRKRRPNIQYTSACLITKDKAAWQYGRFEMRARIDISKGMWPAWWTLGVDKGWPANGEIDIMEYYRGKLLANIACLGKDGRAEWHNGTVSTDSLGGKAWAKKFHVWRMDWTEDFIALYCDDRLLNKVTLDLLVNKDGSGFNPFKQPHYMLLNLAVGGMNGGDPEGTVFPQKFEIDYVRVYQKE